MEGLTVLNRYRLVIGAPEFEVAIRALAMRVEAEGHPGVLGYRFFVHAGEAAARAVVDYQDAAAWIGHHDRSMGWPEMQALHRVARLEEVVFLGEVPGAILDYLGRSGLTARVSHGFTPAAGFRRASAGSVALGQRG